MPNLPSTALYYLLILAGGGALAIQQVLNSRLRVELGSPWWTGFASYVVGLLAMVVVLIVLREPPPDAPFSRTSNALTWTGGIFGAIYICIVVLTVPRFGAATVLALVVVGQLAAALAFDHFGAFGLPQSPATLVRLAGAAFLIVGVALVRT